MLSSTMSDSKRGTGRVRVPKEVWLVFVDHSALGVWLTRERAERAVRLRTRDSIVEVDYRIEGYRRMGGGK